MSIQPVGRSPKPRGVVTEVTQPSVAGSAQQRANVSVPVAMVDDQTALGRPGAAKAWPTADVLCDLVLVAPADRTSVPLSDSHGLDLLRRHLVEPPEVGATIDLDRAPRAGATPSLVLAHP